MKQIIKGLACLALLLPLVACATSPRAVVWDYGIGSNVDDIWATQALFYRNGKIIVDRTNSAGGSYTATSKKRIAQPSYWMGGIGLPNPAGVPVPDKARVEIVSFIDRKRYRIEVDLPADLEKQMRQVYQLPDGRKAQRNELYFGLAPGGYYEVLLYSLRKLDPDILLARGLAEEVTDDWRDEITPLETQYENTMAAFDKKYGETLKQTPPPSGMAWAPIMDAYRAKQPRTDTTPVN
ncbi:DUF2931 family protein [Aeromonas enteropelogenes]|uniref:DUF2931 family protein n=1 Tax=Aeromonas enteropelogenes TaxID=29489 RepID=UPI003BA240B3